MSDKGMELFKLILRTVYIENTIDYKLRDQIAEAAQSVSSNITEGYGKKEYIQFIYIYQFLHLQKQLQDQLA